MKIATHIKVIFLCFIPVINTCYGQINKINIKKIKLPDPYFNIYYADSIPKIVNGKLYTGSDTTKFINDNEKLIAIETFKNGFKTDVQTFYDNNLPEKHYQFKNGKREGISKAWYKSGKIMYDNLKKNGKDEGISMMFFENGNPMYVTDEDKGISMEFYENGKLAHLTKKVIDSSLCHGKGMEEISWYKNGQLKEKVTMNCGKQSYKIYANDTAVISESTIIGMPLFKVGKYNEYYVDGKPKLQGQFEDGDSQRESNVMIGTWKYWDETGKLTREEFFEKGKLIRVNDYLKEKILKKIKD